MTNNKHPKYFEGILQLRNPNKEVLEFIEQAFEKEGKPVISKEEKTRSGYDLYFISNKFLLGLSKKIKEKYGGLIKTSATLHGRSRTGKDLYRVTVLYRSLNFKKGDLIKIEENTFKIIQIDNQILIKDIRTGKKKRLGLEEIEKYIR